MGSSGFTAQQPLIVLLLAVIVAGIFALLAGFIVTSLQGFGQTAGIETPNAEISAETPPTRTPAPTATPATTPVPKEGIWSQVRAARLFDQIAHQVETQRALSPKTEVPLSFLDEEALPSVLRQLYEQRDVASEILPYTALGLVPSGPVTIDARATAGVYVPEHEQLYVATDQPEGDGDAQTVLAHAYVHALQDQHFDLEGLSDRARTVDERLAIEALVGGDAILSTALYRHGTLSSADWTWLTDLVMATEEPQYGGTVANSEAWRRLAHFPHQEGRDFVEVVFEAGGWEAINQAYSDPPRTTEQVLHPARYLERRDEPTEVIVPNLGHVLGEEWRIVVDETMGELVAGLYLSEELPEETSWRAAEGWDGDTFVVWERETGRRLLVWRTVWDSSVDAREFARGLNTFIRERHFPARPMDPPRGLAGDWWETGAGTFQVDRTGRYVTLMQAPDTNTAVNVARVVP